MPQLRAAGYLVMKVDRAKIHLDALNREIDRFLQEPYTVIRKDDTQHGRHIKRTEMKPFDPALGMLTGEFLYCLRSGLDQMAWHLALPIARQTKPSSIYFPIVESIAKREHRRNYLKSLELFPDEVANKIDTLQPHKRLGLFKDDLLWQLNKLCNLDKHSLIPIHSGSAPIYVPYNPAVLVQHFPDEDALEVSVPINDKHELDLDPDFPASIEFGEWESDLIIPRERLTEIHKFFTDTVIPKFIGFNLAAGLPIPLRLAKVKDVYR